MDPFDIPHRLWNDRWARAAIAAELNAPSAFKGWRLGWYATRLPVEQRRIVLGWAIDAFEALIPTPTGPGNDAGPFVDIAEHLSPGQLERARGIAHRMRAAGWGQEVDAALEALEKPVRSSIAPDSDERRRAMLGPLHAHVERRIDDYLARQDWLAPIVEKERFLPLYCGSTAIVGVRPDRTFTRYDWENAPRTFVLNPEPFLQRLAACHGARRYPEIAELIPERPADATTCQRCHGIGVIAPVPHIACSCGGSGWLLAGEPWPGEAG